MSVELNADYNGGATIQNVETISVSGNNGGAAALNFNASGISGLTEVVNNAVADPQGVSFTNVGSLANVSAKNTTTQTTVQYTETAVGGSDDAVTVNVDNVTGGAAINVNSATALGAGVESVTLNATGQNSNVVLNSNDATVSTVAFTGDRNLTAQMNTNVTTSATTLNASAATGNITITGIGAAAHTVTGGTGNDTFTFGTNFTAADTVDGGDGADTLAITSSAGQTAFTAAQWGKVSNVETVTFTDGGAAGDNVAQDMDILTGVTRVNSVATNVNNDVYTYSDVANDFAFGVTGAGQTAESLTVTLKDPSGLSDSVNVDLGSNATTAANGVTLATLNDVAGAETVNIASLGASSATTNTITTSNVSGKLVITGDASITIGAANNATQIDASDLAGNFTLGGGTPYAVAGGNVQGGAGNDVITAGASSQTINGGAGNDQITGGAGADLMTGGTGADQFTTGQVGASVVASADTLNGNIANGQTLTFGNGVDIITDFQSGTDTLNVDNGAAGVAPTNASGLSATTVLTDNEVYTLTGTYDTATNVFTVDSNATASTANVAMLVVEGDGALSFDDTSGYTLLQGVSSLAAGDFM